MGLAFGSGKGKHTATVTVTDTNGKVRSSKIFTSGNMTEAEKALGFPKSTLATHTENRAMRNTIMKEGDKVLIEGEYSPCNSCKGAMNKKAKEIGCDITYTWTDDNGVKKVWKDNKK